MEALADVLQQHHEREEARQARMEEQASNKTKMLSDTKYKATAIRWRRLAGVSDDKQLPKLYISLANAPKGQERAVLQQAIEERIRTSESATCNDMEISKEFTCKYMTAAWGGTELEDLNKGVIFAESYLANDWIGQKVKERNAKFDMVQNGMMTANPDDYAKHFNTTEFHIPTEVAQATIMLEVASVKFDLIPGPNATFAAYFREWLRTDWKKLSTELLMAQETKLTSWKTCELIPKIMYHIHQEVQIYINGLLRGESPRLPKFESMSEAVICNKQAFFAKFPHQYAHKIRHRARDKQGNTQPAENRRVSRAMESVLSEKVETE